MYWMAAWLMPLAVAFRLGFAAFIFLSLRCKCDGETVLTVEALHAFGRDLQPVQYIVIVSSGLLMLPVLAFFLRAVGAALPRNSDVSMRNLAWHVGGPHDSLYVRPDPMK